MAPTQWQWTQATPNCLWAIGTGRIQVFSMQSDSNEFVFLRSFGRASKTVSQEISIALLHCVFSKWSLIWFMLIRICECIDKYN